MKKNFQFTFLRYAFSAIVLVLMLLSTDRVMAEQAAEKVLNVGSEKQLFIDHKFIQSKKNLNLAVNPPVKRPGAILRSDKPWDAFRLIYFSMAEDDGIYKMWYQAYDGDQWDGTGSTRMMYATSKDGLNWKKPNLGLVSYDGSTNNNILLDSGVPGSKLGYVFIDTNPNAPASQRYKMLVGQNEQGFTRMRSSADGIHWSDPGGVVWDFPWDTQKQAWWDQNLGKYVIQVRGLIDQDTTDPNDLPFPFVDPIASNPAVVAPKLYRSLRQLARVEADDIMQPWPTDQARTIMSADEIDLADSDIYHPGGVYQYPHAADAYFMFPMTYQHFTKGEGHSYNDGVNDVQFAASRDGIHWMRYDRKSYISRGLPGEPDYGGVQGTGFHIRRGNYLYQYYTGWPWTHGGFRTLSQKDRDAHKHWGRGYYGVVVQRLDGFVSVDAPYAGGFLVTPPIVFAGNHLELNVNVAAMGLARVEIQDESGEPILGFKQNDCDGIRMNDIAYTVKWSGNSDISALAGRPVRLKIFMRSAKLYAFQFPEGKIESGRD